MGRNKVLQHVQALAEVGRDRCFDNGAVGLRHEAAHPGQLPDLRGGAARAGIGHDIDRVKRGFPDLVPGGVGVNICAEFIHHRPGHLIVGVRPDINDLVVTLAIGDQAVGMLLFKFFDARFGLAQDSGLVLRHDHVFDPDRDTGPA